MVDLLTDFPQAAGAFADMRRYLKLVWQFSDFPSAQAATWLRTELNCTTDPVREGELRSEIEVAAPLCSSWFKWCVAVASGVPLLSC